MRLLQQITGVDVDEVGDSLKAAQCQIPFASLDATHVGAVHAEHISKRFLAEATLQAIDTEAAPHDHLKFALGHTEKRC